MKLYILVQLEDLESEVNVTQPDKDLEDLLQEDNPEFRKSNLKESEIKKSQINTKERSKIYFDTVEEIKENNINNKKEFARSIIVEEHLNETNNDNDNDELNKEYYDEKVEKFYHAVEKMKSIGVLTNEMELMDLIINFCKSNSLDYDIFENKKFFLKNEIDTLNMRIEYGDLDLNDYKKSIQTELELEQFLIKRLEEDKFIKNKNFVEKRIMKRIDIINNEINQQVDEEVNEEEEILLENIDKNEENIKESGIKLPKEEIKIKESVIKLPKEEIKIKESVIIKESPKIKQRKIKNEKLYELTKIKAEEYKAAVEYFIKIESMKQADDAREKAKILFEAISKMEIGEDVDEFSLPIQITPDYICNMTKQERLNNFSTIIKDFSAKKNELNEKLEKTIEGFKTIDKKNFVKHVRRINLFILNRKMKFQKF